MWIKYASLALATLLMSGCSLFATKPKLQDSAMDFSKPIPQTLTAAYNEGLMLLKTEQYSEAETHWQNTAQQWPQYPGIWSNLALSQWHLKQYEQALGNNEKALELNAEFCPAKKIQALLQKETGHFEDAIANYEQAAVCAPKDADIPYNIGIIYDLYLQDVVQALNYYSHAQALMTEEDETLAMWITDLSNRQPSRIVGETE
ncbi:MAG TPA: hypothetical protein VL020_03485 [Pseudomonadales bacterium]|nr:hypothetical protein [Pseudomonadales bacterium]